jgi:penicillin amidase
LANWDFSAPTGIREGYDPGDDPDNLSEPEEEEIRKSVAATIYGAWRGRILNDTVYATLSRLGLGSCSGCGPNSRQAVAVLRNLLEAFPTRRGCGAAGVNFFEVEGAPPPEAARDILILRALQQALDLLSGDRFAVAFRRSAEQTDYRWGKLHRITFEHVLGTPFTIPSAGGFSHVSPALPGVARGGGFEVVDASNHAGLLGSPQDGTFQDGAAWRFVGELTPESVRGFQILPGGQSGVPGSPHYADMLGRWLTNRYHPLLLAPSEVEVNASIEERFEP